MRRIRNPFVRREGYNCFGCSPDNHLGLRMRFYEEGEELVSDWDPENHFQGYNTVLHGGIQATLMDEIASWGTYVLLKRAGVTSTMEVRFLKQVFVNKGPLKLRCRLAGMRRNLADFEVSLRDHAGILCATAKITYFTFSEKVSKEKFYYPSPEEFYEKS